MSTFTLRVYKLLMVLAALSMIGAFLAVGVGVLAREMHWDLPGLDAYAGYTIAAALFLALPETLRRGEHIRVTLLLQRLNGGARSALEWWGLLCGAALALFLAYYATRLAWMSYVTHDVSQGLDATPLWIPQIAMALGSIGFALGFIDAIVQRLQQVEFFALPPADSNEIARVE